MKEPAIFIFLFKLTDPYRVTFKPSSEEDFGQVSRKLVHDYGA